MTGPRTALTEDSTRVLFLWTRWGLCQAGAGGGGRELAGALKALSPDVKTQRIIRGSASEQLCNYSVLPWKEMEVDRMRIALHTTAWGRFKITSLCRYRFKSRSGMQKSKRASQ